MKCRVAVVPMRTPSAGGQVNFDVSGARRLTLELKDRAAEVRPSLAIQEARMQDLNLSPLLSGQPVTQQTLVVPDQLEQPFRRRLVVLVERLQHAAAQPPLRVEVLRSR